MKKMILFNAPRLAGKDVAINFLQKKLPIKLEKVEFKDHLHRLTQNFFYVSPEEYWNIYNDRSVKEVPQDCFSILPQAYQKLQKVLYGKEIYPKKDHKINLSIREALIYTSEIIVKPTFGMDAFGQYSAKTIQRSNEKFFADGSVGFIEELYPLIKTLGQENILLIRIHGRGDFEGDSRSYIPDGIIDNTIDVHNDSTEVAFLEKMYYHSSKFLLK